MLEILFWVVAFIAAVLGTMAGFGISTILLPVALLFQDFRTALVLVAIFHISGNVGRITFFRGGVNRRLMVTFGIPSVLLTFTGALLVNYASQQILRLVLGVFLLAYSLLSLAKPDLSISSNPRNSLLGGFIYGFFSGLIGTGGLLRGAVLTAFHLEKSVYISTSGAISFMVDLTRVPVYLASGFLLPPFYYVVPILFLVAISGSYMGKKVVTKISQETFRKIILTAISLLSLILVYDGIIFLMA